LVVLQGLVGADLLGDIAGQKDNVSGLPWKGRFSGIISSLYVAWALPVDRSAIVGTGSHH